MRKETIAQLFAELSAREAESSRLAARVAELETALRLAADEPNIDKARAIADATLGSQAAPEACRSLPAAEQAVVEAAMKVCAGFGSLQELNDACDALAKLRQGAEPKPASPWRPIESAPDDDLSLLVTQWALCQSAMDDLDKGGEVSDKASAEWNAWMKQAREVGDKMMAWAKAHAITLPEPPEGE